MNVPRVNCFPHPLMSVYKHSSSLVGDMGLSGWPFLALPTLGSLDEKKEGAGELLKRWLERGQGTASHQEKFGSSERPPSSSPDS